MKFKICPACNHKNVSFLNNCEECNADITKEKIYTKPLPHPEDNFRQKQALISFAIAGVSLIILGIVTLINHFM